MINEQESVKRCTTMLSQTLKFSRRHFAMCNITYYNEDRLKKFHLWLSVTNQLRRTCMEITQVWNDSYYICERYLFSIMSNVQTMCNSSLNLSTQSYQNEKNYHTLFKNLNLMNVLRKSYKCPLEIIYCTYYFWIIIVWNGFMLKAIIVKPP